MGTCGLASGAEEVYQKLQNVLCEKKIDAEFMPVGCIGYCRQEPIVEIKLPNGKRTMYGGILPEDVEELLETALVQQKSYDKKLIGVHEEDLYKSPYFLKQKRIVMENVGLMNPDSIDQYLSRGGYQGLSKALLELSPQTVVEEVKTSGLRGRGGGGFSTGMKWEFGQKAISDQKYLVCNADEGDPGAFMDRSILESDPHRIIEGMTIGAYAIGASKGYIYVRAEYPLAIERLIKTIEDAKTYGFLGKNILGTDFSFDIKVKEGAGAFVCGEETALIASIEGRRGMPKPRPPYPTESGIFGKTTVINNVETLANIAPIIRNGGDWFSSIGTQSSKGTKVFALSGNINSTGLIEVPMGISIKEIVQELGGGIPDGKKAKAVQIGGPSGGCIPENLFYTQIDYETLKSVGAMMGSGGMVVMDESTCMVDVAKFFMQFIQNESCGKCTPCREGTKRLQETLTNLSRRAKMEKKPEDALMRFKGMIYLKRLCDVIKDSSLCGLGQTSPNPVLSTLHHFRDEYEAHLYDRKCPAGVCQELLTYIIDNSKCVGCGICLKKCPQEAIVGEPRKPHYVVSDKCIGCDACRQACKFDAIRVE
jgi:NADH:ubiquinone oxidoreductase subunit F (NADH-binding)/Pyruvate/2-oxoacid:ferredoxin oxidoreductase delta subunit/(2Fe-2S) ferredoxin